MYEAVPPAIQSELLRTDDCRNPGGFTTRDAGNLAGEGIIVFGNGKT